MDSLTCSPVATMITVDDDQVRSCGGDSGGIPVHTSGDDAAAGRQMLTAMGEHHHQQLTVSRIRTAVSMLTRRTGHARFRRGPVAERHHASSSDHHQLRPPAAGGGVALDLLVAKTCDDAAAGFSASASWTSSSLPSTTSLTAGEGSVSKGRAQQQGCGALFFVQPVSGGGHSAGKPLRLAPSSMQQHASPGYSSPGNALELEDGKCHDRARSENDAAAAAGKTHGDRCHCSKERYVNTSTTHQTPAATGTNNDGLHNRHAGNRA